MFNEDAKAIVIDNDGNINNLGSIKEGDIHTVELAMYGKKNYPDVDIFKILDYRYPFNVPAYILTKLGNIVFLNCRSNGGKKANLYLSDNFKDNYQEISALLEKFNDYYTVIEYDLYLKDGLVMGDEFIPADRTEKAVVTFERFMSEMKKHAK